MSWYILIPKDNINIYIYYCSVNFLVLYKFVSKKKLYKLEGLLQPIL